MRTFWSTPNFVPSEAARQAEAILSQREHSYLADPEEALYTVYEAARIARIAPGVGGYGAASARLG